MASIHTNFGAIAALQTLRSLSAESSTIQQNISSGLRIGNASDNAAYWSIATTMRSDNKSLSAAHDALGLSAAVLDTAYAGLNSTIDVLTEFSAKLVSAKQDGVDKGKVQKELDQLKQAVSSIASSASFNGQNWLETDLSDIFDPDVTRTSLVASTARNGAGNFSTQMMDFSLADVSLFNSTGGGLLQRDPRDVRTLGGIRSFWESENQIASDSTAYIEQDGTAGWMFPVKATPSRAMFDFAFPAGSSLDFNVAGAEIKFDLILDKEASNPLNVTGPRGSLQELPGPYYDGFEKLGITITKADVDASLSSAGGVITTNTEFAKVLNDKLLAYGATVYANYRLPHPTNINMTIHDPVTMAIYSTEQLHGPGSYVEIANLTSTNIGNGGLVEASAYGQRGSGQVLDFERFRLATVDDSEDGVSVDFKFSINGQPPTSHSFDRTYVNTLLNRDDGLVETADDMVTLLKSLLDPSWQLVIEAASPDEIIIKSDPAVDRETGIGSSLAFSNIRVSIEPILALNFLDIDIAEHPENIDAYLDYLNTATQRIIDGTSTLGALRSRVDQQTDFIEAMMDSNTSGIGTLVDADMDHASTRLKAIQVQQQLSIQALQIANSSQDSIVQLFR